MKIENVKSYLIVTFLAIVLTFLPNPSKAQQSSNELIKTMESKLLDVPDASYKLNISSNGKGLEFRNTSSKTVKGFRLGCVIKKKDKLKVLNERPFENAILAAKVENNVALWFWISSHYFPVEECKKGKLAIVEVALADSEVWKLVP